jgi:hypothetical protein
MPRTDWQSLLDSARITDLSRAEVIRQLTTTVVPSLSDSPQSTIASPAAGANVLSGVAQEPAKDMTDVMSSLVAQIGTLNSAQQTQIGATQDNTSAVTQNTTSKASSGSSVASTVGSIAGGLLGGLSLSPIISSILQLFGGGSTAAPVAATPFTLPPAVQYQAGLTGSPASLVVPVDHGQTGQVRSQVVSSAPQINIQVNAMDSQSFLDHSSEIANAVREAILSSNALTDVIADI